MTRAPAPTPLARAIDRSLNGRGFSLVETLLVVGGLAAMSGASFLIYQNAANNADVRLEQSHLQTITANANQAYGALGSFASFTTHSAIADRIVPNEMVYAGSLLSRFNAPVSLEPAEVNGKANAGLRITYEDVPARACAKLVRAGSPSMFDVAVGNRSVFRKSKTGRPLDLDIDAAIARCANGAPVAFTFYGGTTGLAADVLTPVHLDPLHPPAPRPTSAPPPLPPAVPPTPPPAAPGCSGAPATLATGATPSGQFCSFSWTAVAHPTCWTVQSFCTPIPPPAPPPSTPAPTPPPSVPPPPGSTVCRPPAPSTETGTGTGSCPSGTLTPSGAGTFARSRTRTISYACPDPFGAAVATPGPWGAWSPTAPSACAPICVASSPLNESRAGTPETRVLNESRVGPLDSATGTPNTRVLNCPAGQYGQINQSQNTTRTRTTTQTRSTPQLRTSQQHRTTTFACTAPTGPATATVGAWSAPGPAYGAWGPAPGAWSAPGAPYGAWSAPGAPLGPWGTTSSTCSACPPATTETASQWAPRSSPCPSDQTGSHTWEEVQSRSRSVSYSCPAGTRSLPPATYGTWSAWAWTGSKRNEVNTCTPTAPPGTVCPTRPLQVGCAVYDQSTRNRVSPVELSDPGDNGGAMGLGFGNGDYVQCRIGYADAHDADGFPAPLTGSDVSLMVQSRGEDWESYSQPEDSSSYLSVYRRNADRTRGPRCWGELKISYNWEGK